MDALEIVTKAVIDALSTDTAITNVVTDNMYEGSAEPLIAETYPYILMVNAGGGYVNDTKQDAIDLQLLITSNARVKKTAKDLASAIHDTLHRVCIPYVTGWKAYSTVRETNMFSREYSTQNGQYHQYGAYFRFRLEKGT